MSGFSINQNIENALVSSFLRSRIRHANFIQPNNRVLDASPDGGGNSNLNDHGGIDISRYTQSQSGSGDQAYRLDELNSIDERGDFSIPSPELTHDVYSAAAKKLKATKSIPCAVCEMVFRKDSIVGVPMDTPAIEAVRTLLAPSDPSKIPPAILSQYDASECDASLSGMLLFPRAVAKVNGTITWDLCLDCEGSLKKHCLPKLAIANGNWIGWYPNGEVPWIEEQMVALVGASVSIKTVNGGSGRCLRSHHYVLKNTAGPLLTMLPDKLAGRLRVTLVGAMTPRQIALCKRRHKIDVSRAKQALEYLQRNHLSYQTQQDLVVDESVNVEFVENHTDDNVNIPGNPSAELIENTSSYAVPAINEAQDDDGEDHWVEETSLTMDQSERSDDYLVRQSTVFMTNQQWEHCIDMFPLLFPSGCGGPKQPRVITMSTETWARRVLQLYGSRFERHAVFVLLLFDYLTLENARRKMFFRVKAAQDPIAAGAITQDAIAEYVHYRHHLVQSESRGVAPSPPSENVRKILKLTRGIETAHVAYYGSNHARSQARSDLFGYIKRLGPLASFITISPDSTGTYAIGIACGEIDEALVREANARLLPTKTERRRIATRHPVTCARYFMRVMDILISDILGWDVA